MKPNFFHCVHHLRAAAALAICLFHAGFPFARWHLNAGVPLFFVISGFVIFSSTHGRKFELRTYAWKRFVRIIPLWWMALIWFAGFTIYLGLGWRVDWPYLTASMFLLPTQNANGDLRPYLNVGWTLVYEVFFYLIYGVAASLGRWWLCSVVIFCLVLVGWLFQPADFYLQVYTSDIMLGFVAGCHIAHAHTVGFKFHPMLLPIGIILLILGPMAGATLPCSLILAGAIAIQKRWPLLGPISFLGSASYAIYLFHFSVTYLFDRNETPIHWAVTFALATSLGISMHVLVETPLLKRLRNQTPPRQI